MRPFIAFFFYFAVLAMPFSQLTAQENKLPDIKFPEIPYKPSLKKGWVGQFVYTLHFNDSTGTGKGKNRVYYHVIVNRTNSGYVEFPSEVRGAIRSNQPDKNNVQRYESWIGSGTKNAWSKHDETDTVIVPTGLQGRDGITGQLEKYYRYTSDSNWIKGFISNTDLQIDHVTGKYSFAVPMFEYTLEGNETMIETVYSTAKKNTINRKDNKQQRLTNFSYLGFGDWNMLEGSFKEGQTEIIIRQRIPVALEQSYNDKKMPVKKGFMEFYLVLKKLG
jgi:hypothetical protein